MSQPKPIVKPWEAKGIREQLGIPASVLAKRWQTDVFTIVRWESGRLEMPKPIALAYKAMIKYAPHLLARRARPDWTL